MGACLCCCAEVHQSHLGVIERWGQFVEIRQPGLVCLNCCCGENVAGSVSLRVEQLNLKVETKTFDNVTVHISIAVCYRDDPSKAYDAYYSLANPTHQMEAHIAHSVRARVPSATLDKLYEIKEDLSGVVRKELEDAISPHGYIVVSVLVTDVDPAISVKDAMNEIQAQERLRVAAISKSEAFKTRRVKEAEAEAEAARLAGCGVAAAREAIVRGLQTSVENFTKAVPGTEPEAVMRMVLTTQYFETLKEVGANSRSNVVYLPHSAHPDIGDRIRDGNMAANSLNFDTVPLLDHKSKNEKKSNL